MHGFITTTDTPKHITLPTSTNQLHLEFRLALGLTETKIIAVKRERDWLLKVMRKTLVGHSAGKIIAVKRGRDSWKLCKRLSYWTTAVTHPSFSVKDTEV